MTTIAQIFEEMNNGAPIDAVEGTLIHIYPPLQAGQGTLQNGTLRDDEGSEGKITFSDTTINEKTALNQRIRIESVQGPRGRTGLKVKDDQKYGRAIWVTGSSKITYPGGGNHSGGQEQQQAPAAKSTFKRGGAAATPNQQQQTQSGPAQRGPQRTPEERLGDLADLLAACAEHVSKKVMPLLVNENPQDQYAVAQALTSTLFIQCDRGGVSAGWMDRSNRPLPRPPEDPHQWRECYINSKGSKMHGKKLSELENKDILELFNYFDSKQLNTPLAECVYRAATDLDILPSKPQEPAQPEQSELDPADDDDVPF